jgi:glyoxylase-like metal-dependent hydrolase (beta-lactamase superfamily II)
MLPKASGSAVLQSVVVPIEQPGPGSIETRVSKWHTKWLAVLSILTICQACSLSDHPVVESKLGKPSSLEALEKVIDVPGPIEVETVNSADWTVPLSGLVDLKNAAAQAAHMLDRPEPIHVFVHIVRHPQFGTYMVDTGVSEQLLADPGSHGISWLVRKVMPLDQMHIREGTAEVVARIPAGIQGVFFTHLHVDHISGMPDIAGNVPLYVGHSESTATSFQNLFVRGTTNKLLDGKAELQEWRFRWNDDHKGIVIGEVVDIFGDGSAFAISAPGHTPGSTAYLFRTSKGPVLLTGDTSHTRWGWEHSVEPGSYTADQPTNLKSLLLLKNLASRHPDMEVRLGHQM